MSQDKSQKSQEKSQKSGGTPKEGSGGSQRDGSQQQQGDGRDQVLGVDRGLEGINQLPEGHALRLMYENALLTVRNRQLQWLNSELKQEHLITLMQVGTLRKRRGVLTGSSAIMVDRAVSVVLLGSDVVSDGAAPVGESSAGGPRFDDPRYANLPSVVVNIEDKGDLGAGRQPVHFWTHGKGHEEVQAHGWPARRHQLGGPAGASSAGVLHFLIGSSVLLTWTSFIRRPMPQC
ncbi:hypothetical protein MTO96_035114 [Rhipicephalus appendiculatus]